MTAKMDKEMETETDEEDENDRSDDTVSEHSWILLSTVEENHRENYFQNYTTMSVSDEQVYGKEYAREVEEVEEEEEKKVRECGRLRECLPHRKASSV